MFKFLNKEIIIKKSIKSLIVETFCSTIFYTLLLYFCLIEGDGGLGEFFIAVGKNNLELEVALILFLPLLIIIGASNTFIYVANNNKLVEKKAKKNK